MSEGLRHIRVLVTRPQQQAEQLSALIEKEAGSVISLPMLAIEEAVDTESAQRCKFISGYDWVIFISQNAVRYALSLLPSNKWIDNTAVAAIGQSTSDALRQAGIPVDLQPEEQMNSEALLQAFEAETLENKKVLIVRGVGGRETLATGLRKRQALVDYAEVYRRYCPTIDAMRLSQILEQGIDVITIASGETLQNFVTTIDGSDLTDEQKKQLLSCPIIVTSERVKELARQLGYSAKVIVASKPDNAGLVQAIQQWRSGEK